MTTTGLATRVYNSPQKSSRGGAEVDTIIWHHAALLSAERAAQLFMGLKLVSCNAFITNEGEIWVFVDEAWRAWTSGSSTDGGRGASWDKRGLTVEIENQSGHPNWDISDAAIAAAQRLRADWYSRYNIRNEFGHRDLWVKFRASYPTYCPGPNTVARITGARIPIGASVPASVPTSVPASVLDYGFGLTKAAQLAVQQAFARTGRYTGDQDGVFGIVSVTLFQQYLKDINLLSSTYKVDGIPGRVYGLAVQVLAKQFGYNLDMDGRPGQGTSAAIERWAASVQPSVPLVVEIPQGRGWSYWEPTGELGKRVQRALAARGRYNYSDGVSRPIDGVFGKFTRMGVQKTLNISEMFIGLEDGDIREGGSLGIQKYARAFGDYTGDMDAAPREGSWAGFALGLERK